MILLDVKQGSLEWQMARLGIPTASQFHRIVTPKTMKLSSAVEGYAHELLAEEMLGHPIDDDATQFMMRGTELEAQAMQFYEFTRDVKTAAVGLVLRDDAQVGCSPDRLVGEDGGLELKCPSAAVHVSYMLKASDADKYNAQIQGALWLTGREWWDWLSYNPELPSVLVRFYRDEKFIATLATAVDQFIEYLDECRRKLTKAGFYTDDMATIRADRRRELGAKDADVLALQDALRVSLGRGGGV